MPARLGFGLRGFIGFTFLGGSFGALKEVFMNRYLRRNHKGYLEVSQIPKVPPRFDMLFDVLWREVAAWGLCP